MRNKPTKTLIFTRNLLLMMLVSGMIGCGFSPIVTPLNQPQLPSSEPINPLVTLAPTSCSTSKGVEKQLLYFGPLRSRGAFAAVYPRLIEIGGIGEKLKQSTSPKCRTFPDEVLTAQISERENVLFVQDKNMRVVVFDLDTGMQINSTSLIVTRVHVFAGSGDSVLVGGVDGVVYRWWWRGAARFDRYGVSKQIERYIGHAGGIESVAWLPSGNTFFSGDSLGAVNAWEVFENDQFEGAYDSSKSDGQMFTAKAKRTALVKRDNRDAVSHIVVSKDGSFIVVADRNGVLELWRPRGLVVQDRLELKSGYLRSLVLEEQASNLAKNNRAAPNPETLKTKIIALDRAGNRYTVSLKPGKDVWGLDDAMTFKLDETSKTEVERLAAQIGSGQSLIAGVNASGIISIVPQAE